MVSVDIEYVLIDSFICGLEVVVCGYDDIIIVGLVGLGFDYYLGL